MVARLRDHYGIKDPRVLEAMRSVPRHFFVPEALQGDLWRPCFADKREPDNLPALHRCQNDGVARIGRTKSSIGDWRRSGYQTAVLSKIAAQVYAIERIADLAREAQARIRRWKSTTQRFKCFDGTLGWAAHAPYDAIL